MCLTLSFSFSVCVLCHIRYWRSSLCSLRLNLERRGSEQCAVDIEDKVQLYESYKIEVQNASAVKYRGQRVRERQLVKLTAPSVQEVKFLRSELKTIGGAREVTKKGPKIAFEREKLLRLSLCLSSHLTSLDSNWRKVKVRVARREREKTAKNGVRTLPILAQDPFLMRLTFGSHECTSFIERKRKKTEKKHSATCTLQLPFELTRSLVCIHFADVTCSPSLTLPFFLLPSSSFPLFSSGLSVIKTAFGYRRRRSKEWKRERKARKKTHLHLKQQSN